MTYTYIDYRLPGHDLITERLRPVQQVRRCLLSLAKSARADGWDLRQPLIIGWRKSSPDEIIDYYDIRLSRLVPVEVQEVWLQRGWSLARLDAESQRMMLEIFNLT